MFLAFALKCRTIFLGEQKSKAYKRYAARAAQPKIFLCAKNNFQGQTCFGLERCGA